MEAHQQQFSLSQGITAIFCIAQLLETPMAMFAASF